jgi:Domain of unknown function (DUF4149)
MAGRITWVHTLYSVLLALWLGSFFTVGALAVPVLFNTLTTAIAADVAVVLFKLHGLFGFVVLGLLLIALITRQLRVIELETRLLALVLIAGLLLQFWIIPEIIAQRSLVVKQAAWHMASSVVYVIQAVCVLAAFVLRVRTPTLKILAPVKPAQPDQIDQTPLPSIEILAEPLVLDDVVQATKTQPLVDESIKH